MCEPTLVLGHVVRLPARGFSRPIGREVSALILASIAVQMINPSRHDHTAHVLGGGALMLLIGGLAPRGWAEANPERLGMSSVGLVAICALAAELAVFGPFDLVDVAFTVAGSLVVGPSQGSRFHGAGRRALVPAAAGLLALALVFRFMMSSGPS